MSLLALILAILLFLIAGLVLAASATVGIAPLALIAFGLAAFAVAHLPI
jgi:hypothetical protein